MVLRECDLAVAWEWPYDSDFAEHLLARAAQQGWTTLAITQTNLESVVQDLAEDRLHLRCLLDRASDARPEFGQLTALAERRGTRAINHLHNQHRACDKARNHLLCASQGVPVPLTIIVAPFSNEPSPPLLPAALGRPFVAKPASGGGGQGVMLDVATVQDVQNARRTFWRDWYLLQQRVSPCYFQDRRAWFRVFYVCGRIIPCWWDDITHVYAPLTADEEARYGLARVREIVLRISRAVALDFFTTEIVLGHDGRMVCVDYANSPCDMRLQSRHHDGVPDTIVAQIIDSLLTYMGAWCGRLAAWQALAHEGYRYSEG